MKIKVTLRNKAGVVFLSTEACLHAPDLRRIFGLIFGFYSGSSPVPIERVTCVGWVEVERRRSEPGIVVSITHVSTRPSTPWPILLLQHRVFPPTRAVGGLMTPPKTGSLLQLLSRGGPQALAQERRSPLPRTTHPPVADRPSAYGCLPSSSASNSFALRSSTGPLSRYSAPERVHDVRSGRFPSARTKQAFVQVSSYPRQSRSAPP